MQSGADVTLPNNSLNTSLAAGQAIVEKLNRADYPLHEDFCKAKIHFMNANPNNDSITSYYSSLNSLAHSAQELTAAEDRLCVLEDDRETIAFRYSENQKACAAAVHEKVSSGMTLLVDGEKEYSWFDIYALPVDEQAFLQNTLAATTDQLEKLKSIIEVLKTYPEDHVLRRTYETNGVSEKSFLPHKLRIESILKTITSSIIGIMNLNAKRAAQLSVVITKQLNNAVAPFQPITLELDKMLYQNDKSIALMLAQKDLVHEDIRKILNRLTHHPVIQSDWMKQNAISDLSNTLSGISHSPTTPALTL